MRKIIDDGNLNRSKPSNHAGAEGGTVVGCLLVAVGMFLLVMSVLSVQGGSLSNSKAFAGATSETGSVLDPFSAYDTRVALENRYLTP